MHNHPMLSRKPLPEQLGGKKFLLLTLKLGPQVRFLAGAFCILLISLLVISPHHYPHKEGYGVFTTTHALPEAPHRTNWLKKHPPNYSWKLL